MDNLNKKAKESNLIYKQLIVPLEQKWITLSIFALISSITIFFVIFLLQTFFVFYDKITLYKAGDKL